MTNTKRIVNEVKNENREYTPGPGGTVSGFDRIYAGLTGAGSSSIREQVHSDICRAYCKGDCNVALVGWSRGAVIAMGVASDLQSMGCTCSGIAVKPIKVRFVGLFDAVQMMSGNWPQSVPSNVEIFAHAQKSARQWIFPTKNYGGTSRTFDLQAPRRVGKKVCSASPHGPCRWVYSDSYESLHADIGVSTNVPDAYFWIKSRAAAAGIQF